MRVLVAGATGAIGRPLVQLLLEHGHEVIGMTRSAHRRDAVRALGAEVVVADALDRAAVVQAAVRANPQAIVHELTAIERLGSLRDFERAFAGTNRLRTVGTDNLLHAARAAGARRFVAQSYGGWTYAPTGSDLKIESDPFDPHPPAAQTQSLAAIRYLEEATTNAAGVAGVALRYGNFYGPGTSLSHGGENAEQVRRRRLPIVGDGGGVWSFIHVDDAAAATVAALESKYTGVLNVCDDEPAAVRDWLPELARVLGAKPPMHVPAWLGRVAAGDVGVSMMTRVRGMSNARVRAELGWAPRYRDYRVGFASGLGRPSLDQNAVA